MIPAAFVILPALPRLPAASSTSRPCPSQEPTPSPRELRAAAGETEQRLAALWSDILGVENIGRNDNFFDLGGHSLMAARLVAALAQEAGRRFRSAPCSNSRRWPASRRRWRRRRPAPCRRSLPATPGAGAAVVPAGALWFLDRLDPAASAAYHLIGALRLDGRWMPARCRRRWRAVTARHAALRSRFCLQGEARRRSSTTPRSDGDRRRVGPRRRGSRRPHRRACCRRLRLRARPAVPGASAASVGGRAILVVRRPSHRARRLVGRPAAARSVGAVTARIFPERRRRCRRCR